MRVLVLNAGSSTLKAALVEPGSREPESVTVEWPAGDDDATTAPGVIRQAVGQLPGSPAAVGYRVVHGGLDYRAPTRIDEQLIGVVEELDPLAPLHNLRAAAVMRAGLATLPELPHVACFDTAFHATLPEEAWRYPLPADWVEAFGVRRFGFHGLSVTWSLRRAVELLDRPADQLGLVVAHLGSGCSVTAVDRGRSVDTSMGLTPYEGPMMGTRSGSIDPGILVQLVRHGTDADALEDGLAQRSGLRGVAGTADMREVEARAAEGDADAQLAIAMFARRAAAAIGAAMTTLPGLDALVFTGGIGEHSRAARSAILARLAPLGIPGADGVADGDAILAAGPPAVLVVEAREDLVIAAEVLATVSA